MALTIFLTALFLFCVLIIIRQEQIIKKEIERANEYKQQKEINFNFFLAEQEKNRTLEKQIQKLQTIINNQN